MIELVLVAFLYMYQPGQGEHDFLVLFKNVSVGFIYKVKIKVNVQGLCEFRY